MPSRPKAWLNRFQSSSGAPPGGGTVTRCTCSRRQLLAPAVEDLGDLLHPPEPRPDPGGPLGVADLVEEGAVAQLGAVLDVLLPLGGDLADQVAHAQHEVDLGAVALSSSMTERLEGPTDLRPRGGGEDLVADDRGARPGRESLADLASQVVPGADRVRLEPAPRQLHQVERGEEVAVVPAGRVARCRRPRAPRGCGTARPGSTTCRSSAYRRGGGPCWSLSLLHQQLDRQVEDRTSRACPCRLGCCNGRHPSDSPGQPGIPTRRGADPDPPPQGNERAAAAGAGRRRRPRPSPGARAGRRAARRRCRPAAAAAPRTAARPARRAGRAGSARRRPGGPARWRARARPARARAGVRRPARAARRGRARRRPGRCAVGRGTARRRRAGRPGGAVAAWPAAWPGSPASSGRPCRTLRLAQVWASIVPRSAPSTCTERPPPPGGRPSASS